MNCYIRLSLLVVCCLLIGISNQAVISEDDEWMDKWWTSNRKIFCNLTTFRKICTYCFGGSHLLLWVPAEVHTCGCGCLQFLRERSTLNTGWRLFEVTSHLYLLLLLLFCKLVSMMVTYFDNDNTGWYLLTLSHNYCVTIFILQRADGVKKTAIVNKENFVCWWQFNFSLRGIR